MTDQPIAPLTADERAAVCPPCQAGDHAMCHYHARKRWWAPCGCGDQSHPLSPECPSWEAWRRLSDDVFDEVADIDKPSERIAQAFHWGWHAAVKATEATVDAAEQRADNWHANRDAAWRLTEETEARLSNQRELNACMQRERTEALAELAALAREVGALREACEAFSQALEGAWKRNPMTEQTYRYFTVSATAVEVFRAALAGGRPDAEIAAKAAHDLKRERDALRAALEKSDAGARSCGQADCLHFDCYTARRRARRGRGVIAPGWRDAGGEAGS